MKTCAIYISQVIKNMKFVEHVSKGNSIVGKVIVRRNGGKGNGEKEVHEDVVTLCNPTSIN